MNDPYIAYPTGNKVGFIPAYEGDGLVMDRVLNGARGTVQHQSIPTMVRSRGGGMRSGN